MYPYEDIVFLSATNSRIAGWQIDSFRMYNANDRWSTGLSTTGSDGDPAFWAGYTGSGSTPWESQKDWTTETNFYVTNTGFLHAEDADIEGKITASRGKIGDWNISDGVLSLGNTIMSPYNFQMKQGNGSFIIQYNECGDDLDMSIANGSASIMFASAAGATMYGSWLFIDSRGRIVTLEEIIEHVSPQ